MKSIPEAEFNQDKYDKKKTYGSYVLNNQPFVVGPFASQSDASIWLTKKNNANPDTMRDDHFVLNEMDIHAILERNKANANKPKM